MLYQWSLKGYPSERDIFLTRAILQLLCSAEGMITEVSLNDPIKNTYIRDCRVIYDIYLKLHHENDNSFMNTGEAVPPLINFCRILLLAITKKNVKLFEMLIMDTDVYTEALKRDDLFLSKYLPKIAKIYFGMNKFFLETSSTGGSSNILNSLLQSMFSSSPASESKISK